MAKKKTFRVAMPAWEIGRVNTGFGAKIGGLGVIIEELPAELVAAAKRQDMALEVEVLSPCFAFYDRNQLSATNIRIPVTLEGHQFELEVFKHTFADGITAVYFWDEWQLGWTTPNAIYPSDPEMAYKLFAVISQGMAGYIKQSKFDTVHSHDYHVGLVPFYLGDDYLAKVPHHFTIHNATYQGRVPVYGQGYQALERINLPGEKLFHKYFDHFDYLNIMKAVMIKTHEMGGKITTVSGDIAGSWGYAAELKQSAEEVLAIAKKQKWWGEVGEVFVPNQFLDVFEKLPIAGITNGMSARNRPENLPELKADVLQKLQAKQPYGQPLFSNPETQYAMLNKDHNFNAQNLTVKTELKRLLHLETFGIEPLHDPILITVVGRLVGQKNLGLVADIIERTIAYDPGAKFIILASAPDGDAEGKMTEANFRHLAQKYREHVYYNSSFNLPLSKLIMAGGDFMLIPSRFEPCGLVDYEASLLGNIVIGRLTGGLAKVRHCAYLYEWLDVSDRAGEANAFFTQIQTAIHNYRHNNSHHFAMLQAAMALDASWDTSAEQYVNMYRYGLLMKKWRAEREKLVARFSRNLKDERELFAEFFIPAPEPYDDQLDWLLKEYL